jgi:hypothetical protein
MGTTTDGDAVCFLEGKAVDVPVGLAARLTTSVLLAAGPGGLFVGIDVPAWGTHPETSSIPAIMNKYRKVRELRFRFCPPFASNILFKSLIASSCPGYYSLFSCLFHFHMNLQV